MIILTLVLIFVSIFNPPKDESKEPWYLALEIAVTAMIFLDMFWRIAMQGCRKYCSNCTNHFDVLVCLASVAGIAIGLFNISQYGNTVGTIIIITRSSIQFLRLMTLVRSQRAANVENVKLYGSSLLEAQRKKGKLKGKKSIKEPPRDSIQPDDIKPLK